MARTVNQWLALAAEAQEATAIERAVDEAMRMAESCSDWLTILRALAAHPLAGRAKLALAAERTLAAAHERGEVWGFREASRVCAGRLQDAEAARAALEEGERVFRMGAFDIAKRGYEWALLAEAFAETIGEPHRSAGITRCLDAGRDAARTQRDAGDMARIGRTTMTLLGDAARAKLLLAEAEAMAAIDDDDAWSVANEWRHIGEHARAAEVLERAMAVAETTDDAIRVAKAWASHENDIGAARALDRARALAKTSDDWLDVAEAAFDSRAGAQSIRSALERAALLRPTPDVTARIAGGYADWLGDQEAANRIGPRGIRPEARRTRVRRLEGSAPSASGLLDWLRLRLTHADLVKISEADYGYEAEKNLPVLLDLWSTGLVPRDLGPQHEVIALTRWSGSEASNHVPRTFACVLLSISPGPCDDPENIFGQIVESCLALGTEAIDRAERFFTWLGETEDPDLYADGEISADEDDQGASPLIYFALLLLCVGKSPPLVCDSAVEALVAKTVLAVERWGRPTLLRDCVTNSVVAKLWAGLIEDLLVARKATLPELGPVLALLGR